MPYANEQLVPSADLAHELEPQNWVIPEQRLPEGTAWWMQDRPEVPHQTEYSQPNPGAQMLFAQELTMMRRRKLDPELDSYMKTVEPYYKAEATVDPAVAAQTIKQAYNYYKTQRSKDLFDAEMKKFDQIVSDCLGTVIDYVDAVKAGTVIKDLPKPTVVEAPVTVPKEVKSLPESAVTRLPRQSMTRDMMLQAIANNPKKHLTQEVATAIVDCYEALKERGEARDYRNQNQLTPIEIDVEILKKAAGFVLVGGVLATQLMTGTASHDPKGLEHANQAGVVQSHNAAPTLKLASANTDLVKAFANTKKVTQKVAVEHLKSANQHIAETTTHLTPLSVANPATKPTIDHINKGLQALQKQLKAESPHGAHDLGDQQIQTAQLFAEYPSQFDPSARAAIKQQLSPADLQAAANMQTTIFNGQAEFPVADQQTLSQLLVLIPDTFNTPAITVAPAETTSHPNASNTPNSLSNPELTKPSALSKNQLKIIDNLQLEPSKKEFIRMAISNLLPLQTADIHINLSVVLAQAISESGWGQSSLAREANNYFGMKAGSDWTGPVAIFPTHEVIGGQRIKVLAAFKKFNSLEASVHAYAEYIASRSYYNDASRNYKDAGLYLDGLLNKLNADNSILIAQGVPGSMSYATDPSYKSTILSIIDHQQIGELLSDIAFSAPAPMPAPTEQAPSAPSAEIAAAPEGTIDLGVHTGYHATTPYGDGFESDQIRLVALPDFKSPTSSESQPGDPFYIDGANGNVIVNAKIAANVLALYKAAQADGIDLSAASSFRSMPHQQQLFNVNSNRNEVAFPGRSSHQDGLAFDLNLGNGLRLHAPDFSTADGGAPTAANPRIAPTSAVWVWMMANGHKFGLRQFFNEPWHWELDPNADISVSPSAQDNSSSHQQGQDN
jgi:flagellum-specific peptidoglycan hydrolase FlgJ